jgi:thymidylate kinase
VTTTAAPAPSAMLRRVIDVLNSTGVRYCILHGYAEFPDRIASDVDCLVSRELLPAALPRLLHRRRGEIGGTIVQWLQHEATAHYFVLASDGRSAATGFLAFDASTDYRARGRVFYSGEEILTRRQPCRDFWIPPPEQEFGYYLVKRIAKGSLETSHQRRLSELFALDPDGCRHEIARFWRPPDAELVARAAATLEWHEVTGGMTGLRHRLLAPHSASALWNQTCFRARDTARRVHRWRHPTGLHVVLLGPDGAGKSSVAERLRARLSPAFRRTVAGHFSPDLFGRAARRGSAGSAAPHFRPPRGVVGSILKACYWLADFTIGYWVRVRPALVRSSLVVYDRYLLDALIDCRRYRFAGPAWVLRAIWRRVPKPDLVVLLDAAPELLRERKQEVDPQETVRQRAGYRALVATLPNGRSVDAGRPLDEVVSEVEAIVLEHMAARVQARLGLDE